MKYSTLLFDADDTLYDFDKAEITSIKSFYAKKKITCSFEQFYEVYERENNALWKAFEEGTVTAGEVKVQRFINTMKSLSLYEGDGESLSNLYIDELAKCDFLLDGAEQLVQNISDFYKMIIITNGLWDVQRRRVGESPIYSHFEGLIVSEKVGSAKPHGKIFDEAFKAAENPLKENVLIIGDSLTSDIKGGFLYGIDTCWFNPHKKVLIGDVKPTYEVHSFNELENLLLDT